MSKFPSDFIVDQAYLLENYFYCAISGDFKRKYLTKNYKPVLDGSGYTRTNEYGKTYINIRINGKGYKAHRLIWIYVHGNIAGHVDHINGCGTDNRLSNLRVVSQQDNNKNRRLSEKAKFGIAGIYKNYNKYRVTIGKTNLGYFHDFFEACCARKSAERRFEYHENHGTIRPL